MSDPAEASANLARTATAAIKEAVDTVNAASDKIDAPDQTYDARDLRATFTKLATTSVLGGLQLAETALNDRQRRPSDGLLVMADHMASIAQRTLRHVRGVARQTAEDIGSNPFQAQPWVTAATKLTDIAVVNGIEAAQTAVIGPARYADRTFVSDPFSVDGLGAGKLVVATEFKRPGDDNPIPNERITFSPATLGSDHSEFRVVVNETGMPSGMYLGAVKTEDGGEPKTVALRL